MEHTGAWWVVAHSQQEEWKAARQQVWVCGRLKKGTCQRWGHSCGSRAPRGEGVQLLHQGPAPGSFPSQGASVHALTPWLPCECRNGCELFPLGTGPCEQLLGTATFCHRRISRFPQPFYCVQNFLWNLRSLCLAPRSVQSLQEDTTHTGQVRGRVQRQGMPSVWSLLQHPNTYNPNKSKKASVLGPAWHKLQPPRVCSVVQTLCDPTECISPGSSVHEILQARILGCHFLLQGNLTHPRIKPLSPILQADSLPLSLLGIPQPSSGAQYGLYHAQEEKKYIRIRPIVNEGKGIVRVHSYVYKEWYPPQWARNFFSWKLFSPDLVWSLLSYRYHQSLLSQVPKLCLICNKNKHWFSGFWLLTINKSIPTWEKCFPQMLHSKGFSPKTKENNSG